MPNDANSKDDRLHATVEEWKKNADLYIHHDNLKQSRVRHWLTTQTIFFAFCGLLTVTALKDVPSTAGRFLLLFAIATCLLGLATTYLFMKMDKRARDFILFHRGNLCGIEDSINMSGIATYRLIAKYLDGYEAPDQNIRDIPEPYKNRLLKAEYKWLQPKQQAGGAASGNERRLFVSLLLMWALLGLFLILVIVKLPAIIPPRNSPAADHPPSVSPISS